MSVKEKLKITYPPLKSKLSQRLVLILIILLILSPLLIIIKDSKMILETIAAVLASLGLLLGYILNPKAAERHQNLIKLLKDQDRENKLSHEKLLTTITNVETSVKDMLFVQKGVDSLRAVSSDAMHYVHDQMVINYINTESEAFVSLYKETASLLKATKVKEAIEAKINTMLCDSNELAVDYFGPKRASVLVKERLPIFKTLKQNLIAIAGDELYNSKMRRVQLQIELSMDEYIKKIIEIANTKV